MDERASYLDRVGGALPFEGAEREEILTELGAHLDDSVAKLHADGLTLDAAERTALQRLGPAGALATALTTARRTPRRMLAAAGAGTWTAVTSLVSGYICGLLLVVLGAVAVLIIMSTVHALLGVGFGGTDTATNAGITLLTLAVAACATGVRIPAVVATRAGYRELSVRRLLVPPGAVLWLMVGLVMWRGPLSWVGVVVLLSLPVWFIVGALGGSGTHFPPRGWWPPLAILVTGLAALISVVMLAVTGPSSSSGYDIDLSPIGAATPDAIVQAETGQSGTTGDGSAWVSILLPDRALLAGWHDLRVEAWQGSGPQGWDLVSNGPFAVGAATFARPGVDPTGETIWSSQPPLPPTETELSGSVVIDRTPGVSWAWVAMTGLAPDGTRYFLDEPAPQQTTFDGTVWDWFTATAVGR